MSLSHFTPHLDSIALPICWWTLVAWTSTENWIAAEHTSNVTTDSLRFAAGWLVCANTMQLKACKPNSWLVMACTVVSCQQFLACLCHVAPLSALFGPLVSSSSLVGTFWTCLCGAVTLKFKCWATMSFVSVKDNELLGTLSSICKKPFVTTVHSNDVGSSCMEHGGTPEVHSSGLQLVHGLVWGKYFASRALHLTSGVSYILWSCWKSREQHTSLRSQRVIWYCIAQRFVTFCVKLTPGPSGARHSEIAMSVDCRIKILGSTGQEDHFISGVK